MSSGILSLWRVLCYIDGFDEFGRIAAYDAIWRHIFGNHRICTHDRVLAYPHAREDRRCHAYPHTLFYMYGLANSRVAIKGIDIVVNGDEINLRGDKHLIIDMYPASIHKGAGGIDKDIFAKVDIAPKSV